jgi:tetratricopeptide (TPR) repeat protein
MKQNLKISLSIMAVMIMTAIIFSECTKTINKCMPLTSSSKKAKELAWEAQAILADGFTTKAIELFKQALELDSNFVAANIWYGQNAGLSSSKKHEYFLRAEKNMENVPEAEQHMTKSYLALEKGDRETVVNELKEIIKLYPEDNYMLRLIAVRYYGFGQYENALEYAKKSYLADTNFAAIVYYQGYVLATMGKTEEAENWYKKAIAMKPGVPLYYNNYGQLLRVKGRIDEALEMHKKAVEIGSDYLGNLYLGHCYIARGEYALAREYYSKAFDLSVTDVQKNTVLLNEVNSYLYESKLAEACAAFDKCIDFEKKSGVMNIQVIDNTYNKGLCYLLYKDIPNAEKYINEGTGLINTLNLTETELNNYRKYAIFWEGWFQASIGKTADAQKSLEEFKKSMKDEAELNSMIVFWNAFQGIVAFSKKNWADADKFLSEVNAAVPNYYVGLACQNAGNNEKAREIFTKIVNNNLVGMQLAMVKPFAKNKLAELNR